MPEAMATGRSRRARPRWCWSGAAEIMWPEGVGENLGAVLNSVVCQRFIASGPYARNRESWGATWTLPPSRRERPHTRGANGSFRKFLGALKALSSCLDQLPAPQRQLMSRQLLLQGDYCVIANHDIDLMQAYENDCKAVELVALAIADVVAQLRRSPSETCMSAAEVSEAAEIVFGLVHRLDTSTEDQIATFANAPPLEVDKDADAFRLVCARIRRLQRLVELPLARLKPKRGLEFAYLFGLAGPGAVHHLGARDRAGRHKLRCRGL